jgi:hypothetical protein
MLRADLSGAKVGVLVWAWLEVPEAKSRSFAELDKMFEQKLPTRGFKKAVVWVTPTSRTDSLGDKLSPSALFNFQLW